MSLGVRSVYLTAAAAILCVAVTTSCNKSQTASADYGNGNPADGNLAPVVGQTPPPASNYAPAPATPYYPPNENYYPETGGAEYEQSVEATQPPPPLPEYTQPPCPGDNYMWTPGYWYYSTAGYYWVPGAWVVAPWVGALWTPPWWGYDNGVYIWHAGYWAPHIGFYGGIDYGYGYTGRGYYGAYWNHDRVAYNRAVTNVNLNIVRNVYNYPVRSGRGERVSYNGGGGAGARPTTQELAVASDPRTPAVAAQAEHARESSSNRAQYAVAGRAAPAALVAARPLATSYKVPEPQPPAAAVKAANRPAPETHAQTEPNGRPGFPAVQPQTQAEQPAPRSFPEARPQPKTVGSLPQQQARPEPPPRQRPPADVQASRPEPQRPQPRAAVPAPQQQARPEPQPRPQPPANVLASRPQPRAAAPAPPRQARPEPQPRQQPPANVQASRPQPQERPQPQPRAAAPAPPGPEPQARPEPQSRPEPRGSASRSAPEDKRKER